MKGDFTRFTFKPGQHYNAVRMQQGRVQMDADWNEQIDIQSHRERTEMVDIIGMCGVPEGEGGFRISPFNPDASGRGEALAIEPGRIYVDGLLCELEPFGLVTLEGAGGSGDESDWLVNAGPALRDRQWVRVVGGTSDGIQIQGLTAGTETEPRARVSFLATDLAVTTGGTVTVQPLTTYTVQPDYPEPMAAATGTWLAYLDVWERHVTALDDPAIREVALGGPDTATRLRTVWQVKLQEMSGADPGCDDFSGWIPAGGRMAARAEPGGDDTNPCIIPAEAGYRRLENQLYRVEIHDDGSGGGTPTFKWSRDNGSLVLRLVSWDSANDSIRVSHPRSDPLSKLATDDWVEVLDEEMILRNEPGIFIQIGEINGDELAIKDPSGVTLPASGIVRRWEGGAPIEVDTGNWMPLENGVEVRFDSTNFHRGDYWTIPARTITHDVEWPLDDSSHEPLLLAPQGIVHHTCPLALVEHYADGDWSVSSDCRNEFPPLTDLPLGGCCLRVDPGGDLQQAIDHVVERGGGCICLGAGVHEHAGALRISNANNLTLHGEGNATLLRLSGEEEAGDAGFILTNSVHISLERMLLLGVGVDAVVRTHSGTTMGSSRNIHLRHLTVLNATTSASKRPTQAAVRLANCYDITLTDCALIGENGLICTLGDTLPFYAFLDLAPFNSKQDNGVQRLRMANVRFRYRHWGIWSLRSENWDLEGCDMQATPADLLAVWSARLSELQGRELQQLLPDVLAELLSDHAQVVSGTAIKAFLWRDCQVRDSNIRGGRGLEVWWYLGNRLSNCRIEVGKIGLHADWLHQCHTDHNRFISPTGGAITFVGSYRACIADNRIRSRAGILNIPWQPRLFDFLEYVREVAAVYPAFVVDGEELEDDLGDDFGEWLAFWMLFHETVRITGLWQLISESLDVFVPPQLKAYFYFLLATMIYAWLLEYREEALDADEPSDMGLTAIALTINHNDIETRRGCIKLEKLYLMGGARIARNRLHSQVGRAVELNARRLGENVHLLNALWRFSFKELIEKRIPAWITALQESGKEIWIPAVEELLRLMQSWSEGSESFMEADYRIDSNAIRSQGTAIASNLWELAVTRNHITLREQAIGMGDGVAIIEALEAFDVTHGIAHAVREGTREGIEHASWELANDAVLDNEETRSNAAEAMFSVSARVADERVREYANEVGVALNNGDRLTLLPNLERFIDWSSASTDSHGILLRNPGCRVTDNHILVPFDVEANSTARGGITVTTVGGEDEQGLGSMELLAILTLLGVDLASDPVIGITETLISDNEIIGGFGHGVHINSPIFLGEIRWGLSDIGISGNQIRGMGGAGIVISDETYAVGVDILGNEVADCSSRQQLGAFTDVKGGVVISHAGICRLQNNRIVRCANGLRGGFAFGVYLDTILGAQIDANQLLSNGSQTGEVTGGIYLKTLVDGTTLHDNRFDRDRGFELAIDNAFDIKEIPTELIALVNLYARREDSGNLRPSAISIQDNRIHARHGVCGISSIDELTFAGNQVVMPFDHLANFVDIAIAIVSHNRVLMPGASDEDHSLSITTNRATLVGNITDTPIQVKTAAGAKVEHGLNIPGVDHEIV